MYYNIGMTHNCTCV